MTNTISVPRGLLERIVGKCKLSVLGDDHAKVWELLAAPAVEVEGLEVVGYIDSDSAVSGCYFVFTTDYPQDGDILCSLPKAQAIIDQQAAQIAELEKDAARYRWLRVRMVGVSFDWDDEGMVALAFEMPDTVSFGPDCDANIDAALAKGEK